MPNNLSSMKLLKGIIFLGLPIAAVMFYLMNPGRDGRLTFSIFILFVIFERVWEGLYTSKDKQLDKIEGDWTLPVSIISYILLIVFCLFEFYLVQRDINLYVTGLALFTYLFALSLRLWAVKSLGNQWSVHIIGTNKIEAERRLIKSGPYKYVVHPVYLGIILEQVSIPLVANLYYVSLIILCFAIPFQFLKARLEEKEMEKYLGEEYTKYRTFTPRFNLIRGVLKSKVVMI
jgi:protein-S-isoprenylcysteine O-methyltransferase Ste14